MSLHDAEWQLIGRALLLGFFLSLLYDFLWELRRLGHKGRGITFLCDFLFSCSAAAASFILLQKYSNGMLRWYAVGAVLFAAWLYGRTAQKPVRRGMGCLLFLTGRFLFAPAERYFFHPAKIFLTKALKAAIMIIHPKRKEADKDDTGI